QIGIAQLFGRHLVLRGMFSAAETDALNRALNLLASEYREALGRERRLHKETAVLLHEWAHTLGALHENPRESLMTPTYDVAQSSFSPEAARLVEIGLRNRNDFAAWGKAYKAALDDSGASWDAPSRRSEER